MQMDEIELEVSNIKIAFTCDSQGLQDFKNSCTIAKNYSNFSVLKLTFTYIIFWSAVYINVTKIKKKEDIEKARKEFETVSQISLHPKATIHNIFAHTKIELKSKSLKWIYDNIEFENSQVYFNTSFYPGLRIKSKNGTLIIFQSGKVTSLGSNSFSSLEQLRRKCVFILQQL